MRPTRSRVKRYSGDFIEYSLSRALKSDINAISLLPLNNAEIDCKIKEVY